MPTVMIASWAMAMTPPGAKRIRDPDAGRTTRGGMAFYSGIFDSLGLREWCDADKQDGPLSMAQLIARRKAA